MNDKLIDEFSKLLDFVNNQIQKLKSEDPQDKKIKEINLELNKYHQLSKY